MQVKKIAMMCNSLGGGGAEAVMTSLVGLFASKGLVIDFLVPVASGVHLEKVKEFANLIDLNTKTRYIVPKLISYFKKNNPDLIFSTQTHINVAAVVAAKLSKKKSVIREATTPSIAFTTNNSKLSMPLKVTYPLSNKIVSVSEGVKKDLVGNFNINSDLIKTIYNPILSDDLYTKAEEKIEHPWFEQNTPVIISMGRFAKAKDYPTLIKAFNIIRKSISCKLMILGDTESDASVKAEVTSLIEKFNLTQDIDLLGFKKNPFPYIKSADLYILSSMFEGLPGALIQAKALGCPVISTDCESGPREILENGKNGLLVSVKDYQALAKMAIDVLSSKEEPITLNQSFINKFESQSVANQYIALFNEVLDK